jgi:hypothetical protein
VNPPDHRASPPSNTKIMYGYASSMISVEHATSTASASASFTSR